MYFVHRSFYLILKIMTQTIIMAIQVLPRIKDGNTSVLIDKAIEEVMGK